ncbi:MAG TPA: pyruvate kinase [Candidatus Kapabacteria bacterium]|nr:pyruvate kinase [Candidatus Kapabacteria bacterium]
MKQKTASKGSTFIPPSLQHTKILCTLGPAVATQERIEQLIMAGADAVRLNFSHSRHDTHRKLMEMTRAAAVKLNRHVPVIQDLQGPKIRVGVLPDGPMLLRTASTVILTIDQTSRGDERIPVAYKRLVNDVKAGDTIFIDDGLIKLRVDSKGGSNVACSVINGGLLKDHKGVNLPGVAVSEPALTQKDRRDLYFGLEMGVDYVALSFVRSAKDILDLKRLIASRGRRTPVIAKIEKIEAIRELDAIISVADAIMIARGDLGVELPSHEVPLLQKRIIKRCNEVGKPVITATQMLESMVANPRPTRAESSDVANAVFDGSDAVMLSAETSVGAYPIDAVIVMNDIIRATESVVSFNPRMQITQSGIGTDIERAENAMATAACVLSAQMNARAILCLTYTGNTARMMSRQRPSAPIIAMAQEEELCRQLGLYRGIYSILIQQPANTEDAISVMKRRALEAGVVEEGDAVVMTTGYPLDEKASTNMVVVDQV